MASKHTPGPWRVQKGWSGRLRIETTDGARIANGPGGASSDPKILARGVANARLIAAAPDLLLALKAMTEEWVDYMTINNLGDPWAKHNMKLARAALSKAQGGT